MKKTLFFRMVALLLAVAVIFSLTACQRNYTYTEYQSVYEDVPEESKDKDTNKTPNENNLATPGEVDTDDFAIESGSKGLEQGLDFGGKTITMATFDTIVYTSAAFTRAIRSFESKFNCTVKTSAFAFGKVYNQQILSSIAAGTPYDIAFLHGSSFFDMISANACQPFNDIITEADLVDYDNISAGGIDLEKSSECSWNGKIYGLCGYDSVHPFMIFYNKKKFNESGLEDPRTLYSKGKWTWNKFIEMGLMVTDAANDVYFGDYNFFRSEVVASYGGSPISYESGSPKASISSQAYYNGLKLVQSLGSGSNKIIRSQIKEDPIVNFYNGVTWVYAEEADRYTSITSKINSLNAFGKDKSNLGMVPLPLGNSNKDSLYPTGWIEVAISPYGSKPIYAAAWAKFYSTFKDPVSDNTTLSKEDQQLIDSLLKNINPRRIGFSTSSKGMAFYEEEVCFNSSKGEDISSLIKEYEAPMQACIDATLSQLNKLK